ncbi:dihydrolipoyllysine-residue succinyltransferase [Ghiorsea bivora]|uniref:dihydrolipoyllysine-residue succinyltransferase n=1 Tax=Ghiorsea bivora TaxID=1485545 RepID=UPI000570FD2D|nr:dihydrolipoyllysine-residue succinyltransferase [Ghiorsea bivora]
MFEIKVPSLGESDTEATLIAWLKDVGDEIHVDDIIAEIESDKITMEITATESGILQEQLAAEEDTVEPGQVIGLIDTSVDVAAANTGVSEANEPEETTTSKTKGSSSKEVIPAPETKDETITDTTPLAEREQISVPMTRLRKRIATRLKEAQNTAAMLTTFNEVNMQPIMDMRQQYQEEFTAKFGVKLGFMSFFVKACVSACAEFPTVNAYIDGDDVLYHNYIDMGIAVSTDNGLIVPVLRDTGVKSYAEIEQGIIALASKAREGGLKPDDLQGGTFSITNGGIFGSMLSTPILNTPQSAILGMHTITQRAVVEDDEIVARPMMYLAMSYDHRLVDGKEAVQFLVHVKKILENPSKEAIGL